MKRQKAPYLTRGLAAAHAVLANPTATDAQRCGARRRLNRTLAVLHGLRPIPRMKRRLQVDKRNRTGVAA